MVLAADSARSDVLKARHFFIEQLGKPALFKHCKLVYDCCRHTGLIEPIRKGHGKGDIGQDPDEVGERNRLIRLTALYHVLDFEKLMAARSSGSSTLMPAIADDWGVLGQLKLFSQLTKLAWSAAPISDYANLISHVGKCNIALAVMTADYAASHDTEDRLEGHISQNGNGGSIIRTYRSQAEAKVAMRNDANAGELIFAPFAEKVGLPQLAGKILEQSYRITHPEIHDHVIGLMADSVVTQRLALSRALMAGIARRISAYLSVDGYDIEVIPRPLKHPGKLMRKIYNRLVQDFEMAQEGRYIPRSEYQALANQYAAHQCTTFNLDRINDMVALTAVLDRFKGHDIDRLDPPDFERVVRIGAEIIYSAINAQTRINPDLQMRIDGTGKEHPSLSGSPVSQFFNEKPENGYRSFHFDLQTINRNGDLDPLKTEVLVRTRRWHEIATQGGAAHYLYLGGQPHLLDVMEEGSGPKPIPTRKPKKARF
jgi:hypothetical protein